MSLRRLFSQARVHYSLYAAACLLVLVLAWVLVISGVDYRELPERDYSVRRCQFVEGPAGAEGPVLRILDAVYMENMEPVSGWCQMAELARHFAAVELRSVHRDNLDLRELYDPRYQLVLAKPELMASGDNAQGAGGGFEQGAGGGYEQGAGGGYEQGAGGGYEQIARFPEYGSQLVSLGGMPQLSRQWLAGKRLGLLDDPNSISAYQIPRAALGRAGLLGVPDIVYFRGYREMYEAFFKRKVDVIPALLSEEGADSALQLPPGLVLGERIPGPAWYLQRDLLDSPVHCDLLSALEQIAARSDLDFLRRLSVERPCGEP